MKNKKTFWIRLTGFISWIIAFLILLIFTLTNQNKYFFMGGSSSVLPTLQKLSDNFNKVEADALAFNYVALGSSSIEPKMTSGNFAVGWLSRDPAEKTATDVIAFHLSQDGLVIIYRLDKKAFKTDNYTLNFTEAVMQEIYTEQTTVLWKDVFPEIIKAEYEQPIQRYTREAGSGTRKMFDELVLLGKDNYLYEQTVTSSSQMIGISLNGIGYCSYSDWLFAKEENLDLYAGLWKNISIDLTNIENKSYTLQRPFVGLITKNYENLKSLKLFLQFLFSESAQIILKAAGEVPVSLTSEFNKELKNFLET